MSEERICARCRHWAPAEWAKKYAGSTPPEYRPEPQDIDGVCSEIRPKLVLDVECGSYCQGGTVRVVETEGDFGCILWEPIHE